MRLSRDPVFGVLVLHGPDKPGVLQLALTLLKAHATDSHGANQTEIAFNVTHSWVRSFGPIGVVILRFETTEFAFRRLRRRIPIAEVPPGFSLTVHRAARPLSLDETIPAVAYTAVDRSAGAEDPDSHRAFASFINTLATIPDLDIALYDYFLTHEQGVLEQCDPGDSYRVHALWTFDLARRGKKVIRDFIKYAEKVASEEHEGEVKWNERTRVRDYFDDASRPPDAYNAELSQPGLYGYVQVHALDFPGLFSRVINLVRTTPLGHRDEVLPRAILRSCCRGLGREGFSLVAIRLQNAEDAARLEGRLREEFANKQEQDVRSASHSGASAEVPPEGYWCIRVQASTVPPSISHSGQSGIKVFRPTVVTTIDEKGILAEICDCISKANRELEPERQINLYYLNSRIEKHRDDAVKEPVLKCAMGLTVPDGEAGDNFSALLNNKIEQWNSRMQHARPSEHRTVRP